MTLGPGEAASFEGNIEPTAPCAVNVECPCATSPCISLFGFANYSAQDEVVTGQLRVRDQATGAPGVPDAGGTAPGAGAGYLFSVVAGAAP